jgi:hypothetical protein
MAGGLIYRASELMQQQAAAYRRFNLICERLAAALIRGDLEQIEALTRSGEGELLGLRSRLAQLTSTLTSFAARRSSAADCSPVSPEARAAFESASNELMMRARAFQQTRARVAALATNGVAFATACIEMCGVQPTTYSAPYVRRADSRRWL